MQKTLREIITTNPKTHPAENSSERAVPQAEPTGDVEKIRCMGCGEEILFYMKDGGHEFALGLGGLWECLKAASDLRLIPCIPSDWRAIMDGKTEGNWEEVE